MKMINLGIQKLLGRKAFISLRACMRKQRNKRGFTLLELMVVIIIVSILAAVTIPILRGRIDSAKWSEANAAAGTIRTAVLTYVARYDISKAQSTLVNKRLDDAATQSTLGFSTSDLMGNYFVPSDYRITAINSVGHAAVQVTGSQDNAPTGTKTLAADGSWQ
jgi:prepilin-type N-terminal cleavage/methylation domain-containing protein